MTGRTAPARQIAENAGFDGAVVAAKMLDQKDTNFGFDAQKGDYADLVKTGIIDPVKVVRTTQEKERQDLWGFPRLP
jgi:chaperonin GroEL